MEKKSLDILKIVIKPYAYEILESISVLPKRYSQIDVCKVDRTKTKRLKELKKYGLIENMIVKGKDRDFIAYIITRKGMDVMDELKNLKF